MLFIGSARLDEFKFNQFCAKLEAILIPSSGQDCLQFTTTATAAAPHL